MPIASSCAYIKGLLDGLPLPSGLPNLAAYIVPPDPNELAGAGPSAYIWPSKGRESRNPADGGTIPRNTGPGTPAGTKPIRHMIDVFLIYFGPDSDEDADSLFPGIVDTVMAQLRTSANPVQVTDPYNPYMVSTLIDVGEGMDYEIVISAVADQVFDRYDCLLICSVLELIFA